MSTAFKMMRKVDKKKDDNVVLLSMLSIVSILFVSVHFSFSLGQYVGSRGIVNFASLFQGAFPEERITVVEEQTTETLPEPPLLAGKEFPVTRYSFRYFDSPVQVRSSSAMLKDERLAECVTDEMGDQDCDGNLTRDTAQKIVSFPPMQAPDSSEVHEPVGQHLLLDIKNVDAAFLNSEHRLATAMIDVVKESELTLLSYHCHGLAPSGVSCVGVLLESHVSFHTWPFEGVITLDLFTCGPKSLLPLVDVLFKLFGIPRDSGDEPHMAWTHKRRGFRYDDEHGRVGRSDLGRFLEDVELGKDEIGSATTGSQDLHIYDVIEPRFRDLESHQRSLVKDGLSYESRHPQLFQKDRLVFMDEILMSRRYGEAAYHEALVHPAMITHEYPERVVIVGGGGGAILREVLKHNSVEKVVMLEVDARLVEMYREHLQEWSDCSDLGISSCFDDSRVEMLYVDAVDWFMDHFGDKDRLEDSELFDVAIIDAFDPSINCGSTGCIFDNFDFQRALYNSIGQHGIVALEIGEAYTLGSASDSYVNDGQIVDFVENLVQLGFGAVQEYEEMHGRLQKSRRYMVAMKDHFSRARWSASEAEVTLHLEQRIMRNVDGETPLKYFDGAAMTAYKLPSRIAQERFCRESPGDCEQQYAFNPYTTNHPISSFEVKSSGVGGGRGVFTKVDISQGDYLALDDCVHGMHIPPLSHDLVYDCMDYLDARFCKVLADGYIEGYGLQDSFYGVPMANVDPGIFTFANHGCNGTYNLGIITNSTESTVEPGATASSVFDGVNPVFNPFEERQFFTLECTAMVALRDISANEEMLDNYIIFGGGENQEDFDENLKELQVVCSGLKGIVSTYEEGNETVEDSET